MSRMSRLGRLRRAFDTYGSKLGLAEIENETLRFGFDPGRCCSWICISRVGRRDWAMAEVGERRELHDLE